MDGLQAVVAVLERRVDEGALPGWSLAWRRDDRVVTLAGGTHGPLDPRAVTPRTQFRLSSVSKLVGGLLAASLLADGTVRLEDDVRRWLPELDGVRVLRDRHGPLDDTEPAAGPVTVEHLLTMTAGFGGVWEPCPLSEAMGRLGVGPGPFPPAVTPEEHLRRLASLPLAAQPGTRWLYHTSSDVLGVLLARAAGEDVSTLLRQRVLEPLGCTGTTFHADDLGPAYQADGSGSLTVLDPADGHFARPPRFESLATGLVATASDVLRVLDALVDGAGVVPGAWAARLRTPALTPTQRGDGAGILDDGLTWGLHAGVVVAPGLPGRAPGSFGWDGGTGTSAWHDPWAGESLVVLTARGMHGDTGWWADLWRAARGRAA